ncbi:MAG: pyridoxal-phosphate dependent enzyme [Cyclobacteriaceae bacterium]
MAAKIYLDSPVFRSHHLSEKLGKNVYYKMDCYQPSGSFKVRGMEQICRYYIAKGYNRFIASSGGNAGYSLAYVGKQLGAEVEVIVPETTPVRMAEKIRSLGAKVEVQGKEWSEAHTYALTLSEKLQIPYISPFDHPKLWEGHSSIIDECAATMKAPDKIVVAVGGGGLLAGIFEGMKRNNWQSQVVAAETVGAASFAASLQAGKLTEIDRIDTIATSLGAREVAEETFRRAAEFDVSSFVTDDRKALAACQQFLNEYNVLVEPACGAALSYGYDESVMPAPDETILIIVCGGICMDLTQFRHYQEMFS